MVEQEKEWTAHRHPPTSKSNITYSFVPQKSGNLDILHDTRFILIPEVSIKLSISDVFKSIYQSIVFLIVLNTKVFEDIRFH